MKIPLYMLFIISMVLSACTSLLPDSATPPVDRLSTFAPGAVKIQPETDAWPPITAPGWSSPEPLPNPVNTPGGEDSPFILPDGNTLYFFFTPDVSIPAEKQLLDGLTGIWVTQQSGQAWTVPERVLLSKPGSLALDGCGTVAGGWLYFCTAREGYSGIQWFKAASLDSGWGNWQSASEELRQAEYQVGELHFSADGQELFFHSSRPDGLGGLDIWVSRLGASGWEQPYNLGPQVNSSADEGWPYLSPDGMELWFNGSSLLGKPGTAIYRSLRQPDGSWGSKEEIISSFAGEPTLSADGSTLYFVHHFFSADLNTMLEADIYVTHRLP